jgi:hypothetical protein
MDLLAQWSQIRETRTRRTSIENHLNNMEKLFCDDSDCESTSQHSRNSVASGLSMADDIDETVEDFHIGAKEKVLQLWQGQLGSLLVDTTAMIEKKTQVSTASNAAKDLTENLKPPEDYSQGSKPSALCPMKGSSSADNLSSSLHRRSGLRRCPPTRNASFGKAGIRRGGELSQSAHAPRRHQKSVPHQSEPDENGAQTDHKTPTLACRRNGLSKTVSMSEFDATSDSSSKGTGKGADLSNVSSHRRYRKPDALSTRSEHKRSTKTDVSSD